MDDLIYAAVIVLVTAVATWLWMLERRTRTQIEREKIQVEREKTEIEVEEQRMFGFLHGLGEKLQEDNSPPRMHRYIVDGVVGVIGADAGILYLLDVEADRLVPVYQSEETAPVLPIPAEVFEIADPEEAAGQYRLYIRLSALDSSDKTIWRSMESDSAVHIEDLAKSEHFESDSVEFHGGIDLLSASLCYGRKRVGVLAMTKKGAFSKNDREVFESVAEQSAFALGSAIIHVEAGEKRRYERDLQQASEIQQILLPREAPELSDYEIAASYEAARLVSGDYYDYVKVDEDRYGIVIGDVCGKGIAASLIMAMCRSNLRSRAPENLSPASVLHSVNRSIFPDIRGDMFVSLLYLILERGSNEITMARAGHEPPILYRKATNTTEIIETQGMAAGVDKGPVFMRSVKDYRFKMESGDILLLYTDGLTEVENRETDEFGVDRLAANLVEHQDASSEDLIESIIADVSEFREGLAQMDDMTLIAIEKR